jgi:hypothetical protein
MTEYYWHISDVKNRAYLCSHKPGSMAPPDSPEQFAWEEWIGFVDSAGVVGMRCGGWPQWKEVARLKLRTKRKMLDAAKVILLSLKDRP